MPKRKTRETTQRGPTPQRDGARVTAYTEDQRPCIVARKPCGCYFAACGLNEDEIKEIISWNIESDLDVPAIISFLRDMNGEGITFECRPLAFVRAGGLNFGCDCTQPAATK